MATTKLILGIGLALLVAVGVGWVWSASGRSNSDRALQIAELRANAVAADAAKTISDVLARTAKR